MSSSCGDWGQPHQWSLTIMNDRDCREQVGLHFVFATVDIPAQGINQRFEERQKYMHPLPALLTSCTEGCCVHAYIEDSCVFCSKS